MHLSHLLTGERTPQDRILHHIQRDGVILTEGTVTSVSFHLCCKIGKKETSTQGKGIFSISSLWIA